MSRDKEHALRIILPLQHPDIARILTGAFILGRTQEILEQEPHGGFHALAFNLPQADLIDDGRGQEIGVLAHLRVRVRVEEIDDLIARDAHADGPPDRFARHFAGNHVRVAGGQAGE